MAGGPIYPSSAFYGDSTGRLFPAVYAPVAGSPNDAAREQCHGVVGSFSSGGNALLHLRFHMPPTIPTGTLKLRSLHLCNATSGAAAIIVEDGTCPVGSKPGSVTLTAETLYTVSWATGEADKYKEVKTTLTATPAANDILVVAIKYTTSTLQWTLASQLNSIFSVIWE